MVDSKENGKFDLGVKRDKDVVVVAKKIILFDLLH